MSGDIAGLPGLDRATQPHNLSRAGSAELRRRSHERASLAHMNALHPDYRPGYGSVPQGQEAGGFQSSELWDNMRGSEWARESAAKASSPAEASSPAARDMRGSDWFGRTPTAEHMEAVQPIREAFNNLEAANPDNSHSFNPAAPSLVLSTHLARTFTTELLGSFTTNLVLSGSVFAISHGMIAQYGGGVYIGSMFAIVTYQIAYLTGLAIAPNGHINATLTLAMVLFRMRTRSRALVAVLAQLLGCLLADLVLWGGVESQFKTDLFAFPDSELAVDRTSLIWGVIPPNKELGNGWAAFYTFFLSMLSMLAMVPCLLMFTNNPASIGSIPMMAVLFAGPFSMFQGVFGHTIDPGRYAMGVLMMSMVGYPAGYTFHLHENYFWVAILMPLLGAFCGVVMVYFVTAFTHPRTWCRESFHVLRNTCYNLVCVDRAVAPAIAPEPHAGPSSGELRRGSRENNLGYQQAAKPAPDGEKII